MSENHVRFEAADPKDPDSPKAWYFYDEAYHRYGPYTSEAEADYRLRFYFVVELDKGPEGVADFLLREVLNNLRWYGAEQGYKHPEYLEADIIKHLQSKGIKT